MLPEERSSFYEELNQAAILHTIMLPVIWLLTAVMNVLSSLDMNTVFQKDTPFVVKAKERRRSDQYVLVTGCDRGFGEAIAKKLDEIGYNVIAGCLEEANVGRLKAEGSSRMNVFKLDVTDGENLDVVYQWLKSNLEDKELRGIVNNAGVCFVGTPEIMASCDINRVIDVNFKGTVNVTRKFLPFVRQSQGRVVNIGSINGEVPMPFFSIYNSTKAAVKMFTDTLAHEVKNWGVKVSLVAPAGFKTGIIMYDRTAQANKWWAEANDDVRESYGKDFFTMPMRVSGRIKVSDDYSPVVNSVLDALTEENPRPVYRVGAGSAMLPTLCRYLPHMIKSYICGGLLNFIAIAPKQLRNK